MLFNSFDFIVFFTVVVLMYYILPFRFRWLFLLMASYYFYMASEPVMVLLLMASTLIDYFCGIQIHGSSSQKRKKWFLLLSIGANVGILIAFKYLFFFIDSFNQVLAFFGIAYADHHIQSYNVSQILIPVGISFYTFQTMSYTIEVYRGNMEPERHLGRFALFVAFFPQLVAGPIEKATRLLPQLKKDIKPDLAEIKKGLALMAWGFFLKLVVSDRIGVYVDYVYDDPENNQGIPLVLGAFLFIFQIYYDFSAYTAIAIGAAKVMGINLTHNFNRPLFATSISSFWRRWHISLTHWIRDYMFFPLRRSGKLSRVSSTLIVFFIMGLWHGANWTFVIWGALNGIFLVIELGTGKVRSKLFKKIGFPQWLLNIGGWAISAICLTFSLIFFRSSSFKEAMIYIKNMFQIHNLHFNVLNNYLEIVLIALLVIGVQIVHYFKGNNRIYELINIRSPYLRWGLYTLYILLFCLLAINRQKTFIYFQF